jgi:hypothetical protein
MGISQESHLMVTAELLIRQYLVELSMYEHFPRFIVMRTSTCSAATHLHIFAIYLTMLPLVQLYDVE